MIGIPVLDNLTDEELVNIANDNIRIRIPELSPIQLSVQEDIPKPQLNQFKEMDNNTIIILCKMEIESRAGWRYLRKLIQKTKQREDI